MKKLLIFSMFVIGSFVFGSQCFADDGSGFAIAQMQMNQLKEQESAVRGCVRSEIGALESKNNDKFLYQNSSYYDLKMGIRCGGNGCTSQQVVFMPANHYFKGNKVSSPTLYACREAGNTRWGELKIEQIASCDENLCAVVESASTIGNYFIMDKSGGTIGISTGSGAELTPYNETNICKCKTIGEAIDACKNSGGSWANGKCSCSSSKNIKLSDDEKSCVCINSNYEPDGVNGCKKTQAAINEENRQRQEALTQQRKKACEDSGGAWENNQCVCDNAKNLKVSNNVCVCLDDVNYKRNGDRCDLTDVAALQQKCLSESSVASGAYWDDENKQCRCTNQQHYWNEGICQMNTAILQCLQIPMANWNYTTGQCYCVEFGKVINPEGTACVDAISVSAASSTTVQTTTTITQQQSAREKISSAKATLDEIKSGLKLTVWRDEEGNFNTSRLLSDSIAGVVLGTAGGLITSNVVKKNQIEDGFEDIQCSVGGQVVAGWGDEFRVGIQ